MHPRISIRGCVHVFIHPSVHRSVPSFFSFILLTQGNSGWLWVTLKTHLLVNSWLCFCFSYLYISSKRHFNKAVYTTTSVACGWAEAVMWGARNDWGRSGGCHIHDNISRMLLARGSYVKTACEAKVLPIDRQTNQPTDTVAYRDAWGRN